MYLEGIFWGTLMKKCILVYTLDIMAVFSNYDLDQIHALFGVSSVSPEIMYVENFGHKKGLLPIRLREGPASQPLSTLSR